MSDPSSGQRLRRGQPRWIIVPVLGVIVIGAVTRGDRVDGTADLVGLGLMAVLAVVVVVGLTLSRRGGGR